MTTINQVVTRLLFETNVERIEKINASIREYKKNLSDAKKELKDFNKTYKEQSKKLQQDLKSINREDFVSGETERLRHKLEKLELALGKTNRKRRKAKIEKEIGQTRTKLELSEGSDERKYEVSRRKAQKAIEDTTKQHEARKEKYEEEIEQTKENIETNKELSRKEKDNLNKTMVAFSRFAMAIGVANIAVNSLVRAFNYARDTISKYQEGAYGTDISEEEFVRLANVGETMTGLKRDKIAKDISKFATRGASAMRGKDNAFFGELGDAGLTWYDTFEKSMPIWQQQAKAGLLDDVRIKNAGIPYGIRQMIFAEKDFEKELSKTALGATAKQNKAKMEAGGEATRPIRNLTSMLGGGGGYEPTQMFKDFGGIALGPTPLGAIFQMYRFLDNLKSGNSNITINNTIHTNNPDVAERATGHQAKLLKAIGGE